MGYYYLRMWFLRAVECFKGNIAPAFFLLNFWQIKRLFQLSTKAVIPVSVGGGLLGHQFGFRLI
jgi:hypothetical protein